MLKVLKCGLVVCFVKCIILTYISLNVFTEIGINTANQFFNQGRMP